MNRLYQSSANRANCRGSTTLKLVFVIVLAAVVAGFILMVPHLMAPDEQPPVSSSDAPAVSQAPPPPVLDPSGAQSDDSPDAPEGEPADAAEGEPAAPADDEAPAAEDATPEAGADNQDPTVATDEAARDEQLGSTLPQLEEVDEETLRNPRQSPRLLPALRKYEIDLEKGQLLLNDVRDGTSSFDESPFFWVLNVCKKLPAELFEPEPEEREVAWRRLWQTPDLYRGWPITLSGRVGSVYEWELPHAGAVGLERVWIVELFKHMEGSRLMDVCTLVLTEDPGDLEKHTEIRARGYFFKVRSYEVSHDNDVWRYFSPVVIGKMLVLDEPAPPPAPDSSALGAVTVVALIIFALILLVFIRRVMTTRGAAKVEALRQQQAAHHDLSEEERRQRLDYLEQMEKNRDDQNQS